MDKDNDIYEEMDRIKRRITQLEEKLGGGWYSEKEKLRKSTITAGEKRELEQLHKRLEQLKKEEDKSQGLT